MNTTERIRKQLQGAGIEHYRINESRKQSAELFYIKKDLDIVRSTDVADCTVTVYRDFESGGVKMRGSAAAMIYPDMTETEIGAALRKAYDAALYVKNKFYELPDAEKRAGCGAAAEAYDLISEAFQMADALFTAEEGAPGSFLNSAEIFAERRASRVLCSTGIDISYVKYSFHGEFVTQCIADGQDIELHTSFSYRAPEYGQLAEKARAALKNARDRAAAAAPPPAGRYARNPVGRAGRGAASLLRGENTGRHDLRRIFLVPGRLFSSGRRGGRERRKAGAAAESNGALRSGGNPHGRTRSFRREAFSKRSTAARAMRIISGFRPRESILRWSAGTVPCPWRS